jgi:hypothetical protein
MLSVSAIYLLAPCLAVCLRTLLRSLKEARDLNTFLHNSLDISQEFSKDRQHSTDILLTAYLKQRLKINSSHVQGHFQTYSYLEKNI